MQTVINLMGQNVATMTALATGTDRRIEMLEEENRDNRARDKLAQDGSSRTKGRP
jgi:hypothetical protein